MNGDIRSHILFPSGLLCTSKIMCIMLYDVLKHMKQMNSHIPLNVIWTYGHAFDCIGFHPALQRLSIVHARQVQFGCGQSTCWCMGCTIRRL